MKNFKKLLAVALSLAILLTLTVPVMAANLTNAAKVELLGILQGEGNGVTDEYLAKATTRIQGAVLLLRLIGKEDEALAYAGVDNFDDVVGNEWFHPITAYLKANPQHGFIGYEDGTFKPLKVMSAAEFYKVLLTILGYEQNVDYTWAQVSDFSEGLGLVALENPTAGVTNADMADAILEALQADMKSGVALLDSLIADGIISSADANAAGLVTELGIVSAVPTNADEITVTFSQPVEGSPVITVKSGFMNIFVNQKWNAAKTQVVLERPNNIAFNEGTYEVAVADMKAAVKFDKEVAQSIAISKSTVLADGKDTFKVLLYNQYGKEMSVSGQTFSATAFDRTTGNPMVVVNTSANNFDITTPGTTKENHIIVVTVMHHQTTLVGQAELTAVKESQITQFAMTEVVLPKDATMVNTGHTNVEIKYQAFDQYGNAMKLKQTSNVTSGTGLTFISSNEGVLKVSDLSVDKDGKLFFSKALKAGTVTLSVLVNSSAVVTSLPITIYDEAAIAKIVIDGPLKEVVEDEATEISFVALDQFGNELKKSNVTMGETKLSFSPVIYKDLVDFEVVDGVLKVAPLAGSKGYITVYYYWNKVLQGSFTINVWEKAVPTGIESVPGNRGVELGATQTINAKDIKVIDQYGRAYKDITVVDKAAVKKVDMTQTSEYKLTADPATSKIALTPAATAWNFTADAKDEGSVTYTIQLKDKADSAYSFSMKAVDVNKSENGVTYSFAKVPTLYSGNYKTTAAAGDYAIAMSLVGKTSDGTTVTLKAGKIHALVSSNTNIFVDGLKIYSSVNSAQTTTVRAYDSTGKLLAQADVNATKGRAAAKVEFDVDKELLAGEYTFADLKFKVKDQYGVDMVTNIATEAADKFDLEKNGFFATETTDTATISIDVANSKVTIGGKGEITLTYITANGYRDSIVITIK